MERVWSNNAHRRSTQAYNGKGVELVGADLSARVRSLVGRWPAISGCWLGVYDIEAGRLIHSEGTGIIASPRLIGVTESELRAYLHPEELPRIQQLALAFQHTLDDERAFSMDPSCMLIVDHQVRAKDGTYRRVTRHVAPFDREPRTGRLRTTLHLCRDVTDLRPLQGPVTWEFIGPECLRDLFMSKAGAVEQDSWMPTRREREILRLLALGNNSKQIAEALCLSVLTVNGHRRNMIRKSRLPNATALTQCASRHGWV